MTLVVFSDGFKIDLALSLNLFLGLVTLNLGFALSVTSFLSLGFDFVTLMLALGGSGFFFLYLAYIILISGFDAFLVTIGDLFFMYFSLFFVLCPFCLILPLNQNHHLLRRCFPLSCLDLAHEILTLLLDMDELDCF